MRKVGVPVPLELHRKYARQLGFDHAVEDRLQIDVCDLTCLGAESFDAVVCYGGPLSYVFERAPVALQECVRVCRTGELILASVMSLWGGAHRFLKGVLTLPPESNRRITDMGDLTPKNCDAATHRCHMFRSGELRQMVEHAGLMILAMSASNCLSAVWDELLTEAKQDPQKWQEVLGMELEACREDSCLDMGTHMIIVCRKN